MSFHGVLSAANPRNDCVVRYVDIACKTRNPIGRKIDDTQSKASRFGNVPPLIYDPVCYRSTTYSAADLRKIFVYEPRRRTVHENIWRMSENCNKSEDLTKTYIETWNGAGEFSESNMEMSGANSRIPSSATSILSNTLQRRKLNCQYCNKGFLYHCHLRVHERIHTAEKPYQCNICQRRFSQRGSLKVHKRIHLGLKPYLCGVCGRRFRHVNSSKRHEKKVHYSGKKHADIQKMKKNEVEKAKANHPEDSATHQMQHPLVDETKPSNLVNKFPTTRTSEIELTRNIFPIKDNVLCPDKNSCRCKIWKPYL